MEAAHQRWRLGAFVLGGSVKAPLGKRLFEATLESRGGGCHGGDARAAMGAGDGKWASDDGLSNSCHTMVIHLDDRPGRQRRDWHVGQRGVRAVDDDIERRVSRRLDLRMGSVEAFGIRSIASGDDELGVGGPSLASAFFRGAEVGGWCLADRGLVRRRALRPGVRSLYDMVPSRAGNGVHRHGRCGRK